MTRAEEIYKKNFNEFDTGVYTEGDRKAKQACINAINEALDIPVVSVTLPRLEEGDKIKLYGTETTVTGFNVLWNDALEPPQYETILLTTGRGDPFYRSLDSIEVLGNER